MANPDHIKWLLCDGVPSWNNRRRSNNITPDFSKADLCGADLKDADLSGAILDDAKLVGADLRDADLRGTNLLRSEPWRANLFADQHDTHGKIAKKICSISSLLKVCQDLQDIYGDDYRHGRIRFYFRGESQTGRELRPSVMRPEKKEGARLDGWLPLPFRSAEEEMLRDLISRQPETFNSMKSTLAQWVVAQHHGLKTRLLDVTRNPLVSLFNACEKYDKKNGQMYIFAVPKDLIKPFSSDAISVVANFAKLRYDEQESILGKIGYVDPQNPEQRLRITDDTYRRARGRLHHFICQEKPYFQDRIDPRDLFRVFVVEPQQSFERIRAQAGAFLISAFHSRFEREEILKTCKMPIYDYYKLSVCFENKPHIIKDLRLLNVTRETLYPGLDEAAKAVANLHTNYARR